MSSIIHINLLYNKNFSDPTSSMKINQEKKDTCKYCFKYLLLLIYSKYITILIVQNLTGRWIEFGYVSACV